MGGSSAINILALIYPHRSTFDAWETHLGNAGWGWDGIKSYYTKAISTQDPTPEAMDGLGIKPVDRTLHGDRGAIQASYATYFGEPVKAWIPTFRNLGLESGLDSKTGEGCGAYTSQATIDGKTGQRSHAGIAYHGAAAKRPNYHVITEATVQKLMLNKRGDRKVVVGGVIYTKDGATATVCAKRDVVLCAGVFKTPQLLELSGIGNPDILSQHGIETIVESRFVGENLQDHPLTGLCFEVRDGVATTDMIRDPSVVQAALKMYSETQSGPLASPFGGCAAMLPVREWTTPDGQKALQHMLDENLHVKTAFTENLPSVDKQYEALRKSLESPKEGSAMFALGTIQMHFEQALQKDIFSLCAPENYVVILSALTSPLSRGSTHITSADPLAKPAIDPQYLVHPVDVEVHARQVRFIEDLVKTEPLAGVLKVGGAKLPRDYELGTVDKAKEHVRRHVISNNHSTSSCAMMPKELGGVVDNKLKVYGVEGLRIVDASVMPMIPKGNIQSSVYAVAEKAADLIKADAKAAETA